MINFK